MKIRKISATLLILALVFSLAACGQKEEAKGTKRATEDSGDFKNSIMFCGSTSLYPIISSLAASFTEEYETWNKVNAEFPESHISIYVAPGGSGVGVSAMLDGTCDFGMLARDIKDEEKEKIGKGYTEYVVAKDALTVSVNAQNPITDIMDNMETDVIRDIFSGKIATWDKVDVSLPAEPIQVFIRDMSGGAYEVFQKTVMGDDEVTASATQSASMTELATNISTNKWAIGYAGFGAYTAANESGEVLKALKVDGIECNKDSILSGDYKIQRPVMFIGDGTPTAPQQAFIDYVFSDIGTKTIEDNGYIPAF